MRVQLGQHGPERGRYGRSLTKSIEMALQSQRMAKFVDDCFYVHFAVAWTCLMLGVADVDPHGRTDHATAIAADLLPGIELHGNVGGALLIRFSLRWLGSCIKSDPDVASAAINPAKKTKAQRLVDGADRIVNQRTISHPGGRAWRENAHLDHAFRPSGRAPFLAGVFHIAGYQQSHDLVVAQGRFAHRLSIGGGNSRCYPDCNPLSIDSG